MTQGPDVLYAEGGREHLLVCLVKLQRILQNMAEPTVIANSCCINLIALLALEM